MTTRESDPLIVLRERESRSHGEGADSHTEPAQETLTGHEGPEIAMRTSLQGIAKRRWKRVWLKSPVRENRTPGSVRGASGNRRPYRDGIK